MTSAEESRGAGWLAGEASGDYLASLVLPEVGRLLKGAPQFGIGGPRMVKAGLAAWYGSDRLAVRGYMEVIKKLPQLIWLRSRMISRMTAAHPRVFIGVDAPDFNLGIEEKLRLRGIPIVHLVSPAVWAWRPQRIHAIARAVDHMLLIFPFEEKIYKMAGIPATYIGHPLAGIIPMKPDTLGARRRLGFDAQDEPVYAVLPGSRIDEVSGCAPVFFAACQRVLERAGKGRFLIAASDAGKAQSIGELLQAWPQVRERSLIVTQDSHSVLEASDVVLVASGTATLEAALYKKPMVVGYVMPGITALMILRKGIIPYVSLPNILAGRMVVPEFLQYFCTSDALAVGMLDQLEDSRRDRLVRLFTQMHEELLRPTARLAADAVASVLR